MPSESSIRAFFETLNQRDLEKMERLLSPDAEFYFPKTQPLIGQKRILKLWIKNSIRILRLKSAHREWRACLEIFENTNNSEWKILVMA